MDYNEFSTLIKDSRLISKSLSISDIQMIFFEANEEDVRGEASNPDFELMAHEFVEGLIRLSDKVRSDESHRQGAALSGEGGAGGVTEGDAGEGTKRDVHRERQDKASKYPLVCSSVLCRDFMWVMENHVLKFGCKSTTDEWRQALNTRQTKVSRDRKGMTMQWSLIISFHRLPLLSLFLAHTFPRTHTYTHTLSFFGIDFYLQLSRTSSASIERDSSGCFGGIAETTARWMSRNSRD